MATVREATLELLRAHGMTTIFGNPGSTELPMLAKLPAANVSPKNRAAVTSAAPCA